MSGSCGRPSPWELPSAVPFYSLSRLHNTTSEAAAILRHTTGKGRKASDGGSFKQRPRARSFLGASWRRKTKAPHQWPLTCFSIFLIKSRDRKAPQIGQFRILQNIQYIIASYPLYRSPSVQQFNECLSLLPSCSQGHFPRHRVSVRRESIDGS